MDARWMPRLRTFFVAALSSGALFLTACGGGGGGGSSTPPPSGLSYQTPQAFTVGQAITPLSPTVTGTVTSYSVSPTLPGGLGLNTTTGAISGTPAAVTAQAKYTVTASNSAGSTTADVTIAVNDVKPAGATYSSAKIALATGVPITRLTPTPAAGGGAVASWSISPDLPAGLTFSTADGSISGTPSAASPATTYTISAINSGGQTNTSLVLSVESGVLLDLGHANGIATLRSDGTHVLSADGAGHWVLWDYASGTALAQGNSGCSYDQNGEVPAKCARGGPLVELAGSTIAIMTPTGFELRAATDGHLTATVDAFPTSTTALAWWKIAADGSYIVAAANQGLQAWSAPDGHSLLSKSGAYPNTIVAVPGEIRVANGPAGPSVIETITVATGASTISPQFQGTFKAWFVDGGRFLSTIGTTLFTYSSAVVQEDLTSLTSVGTLRGFGTWFINQTIVGIGTQLDVYKVGASATPTASFVGPSDPGDVFVSGTTLGLLSKGSVGVLDLSGATPVKTDYPTTNAFQSAYCAASAALWFVGSADGVLLDGSSPSATPRYLSRGRALSITGSTSRFAVTTATGSILYYDATTLAQEGSLAKYSSKALLSADGNVLVALGDNRQEQVTPDFTATAYSLPSGNVLNSWPAASDMNLSASGNAVVFLGSPLNVAYNVAGGGPIWSKPPPTLGFYPGLLVSVSLSPDGSLIAEPHQPTNDQLPGSTSLYHNGVLSTAFNNMAIGWLDNGHMLVEKYDVTYIMQGTIPNSLVFNSTSVYDTTGAMVASTSLPELRVLQILDANTIYAPQLNSILPLTGGATWSSGDPTTGQGAVAGSHVVFASGARVLALSR